VSEIKQFEGDNDFGSVSDKLKRGNYTIVIAGASENYYSEERLKDTGYITGTGRLSTLQIDNEEWQGIHDIFYKKFNLYIDGDTVLNQIQLDKLTGRLEIKFTDSISPDIVQIRTSMEYEATTFKMANDSFTDFQTYTFGYSPPFDNIGGFHFGAATKAKVTIQAYTHKDYTWTLVAERVVDNVYIYPNKTTILTGQLSDSSKTNIPIIVDPQFGDTINIKF
jgi:hypothetical protein